jgi:tetratricopeptide (TPR) repeat protein
MAVKSLMTLFVALSLVPIATLAQGVPQAGPATHPSKDPKKDVKIEIEGTGGGSGSGGATFDWDGPDEVSYGIYDHSCLRWVKEFEHLVRAGDSLIGAVAPAAKTWQATLVGARAVLGDAGAKATYTGVKSFASATRPDLFSAGAATSLMIGNPKATLAQLLAGIEAAPDDPDLLFNFAAALAMQKMPNESLAAIERLRSLGKLPVLAYGVNTEAALAYLVGYDEMLRGRLVEAKTNFNAAIARGPFLYEAKRALALVQAHEGNSGAAKNTYLDGLWRFKPKQLVYCSDNHDEVRPPVDDMFDTSKGVEGRLVNFWLPDKASDLGPWGKMVGGLATERLALAEPLKQRMIEASNNPKFANTDTPYNAWANKMTDLIDSLENIEPYVLAARDRSDRAIEQAQQVAGRNQADVIERVQQLALMPGEHCLVYRSLISQGIRGVVPYAERYEAAQREYARIWFKIATGLNARIGDAEWRERNDLSLRAELESMNAGMLAQISLWFSFPADIANDCPEPPPTGGDMLGQPTAGAGSPCDQLLGGLKFSNSFVVPGREDGGPKISYEVGCDRIKADIKYDLLAGKAGDFGTALGGFASIDVGRNGDYTVFAGARAEANAPGVKGGIKSGLYLQGDNGGVTGVGGRVTLDGSLGYGKLSKSAGDDMKFNLLPEPPAATRGPALRAFVNR